MGKTIALYGGGFKPPTLGHFEVVKRALAENPEIDEFIIYVGAKERNGITQAQSIIIWEIYQTYLPMKVRIEPSKSPIGDIMRFAKENTEDTIYFVIGSRKGNEGDEQDYQKRTKNVETKYPNTKIKLITTPLTDVSGTKTRDSLKSSPKEFYKYLPKELTDKEKEEVYDTIKTPTQDNLNEVGEGSSQPYKWEEDFGDYFFTTDSNVKYEVGLTPIMQDETQGISIEFSARTPEMDGYSSKIEVGRGELFRVMATIINIIKSYIRKDSEVEFILYSPSKKSGEEDINNQRDKLYKAFISKQLPGAKIKDIGTSAVVVYLPKKSQLNENASYSQDIDVKSKIMELTQHMLDKGMNIEPLPAVEFVDGDSSNAREFLGKTAYYNPENQTIVLYTEGRHPKDIVRSFAHEMIHHIQNLEGRLGNITTTNTHEDDELNKIEAEANLKGTMTFRNWTDSLNEGKKGVDNSMVAVLSGDGHQISLYDFDNKEPLGLINTYGNEVTGVVAKKGYGPLMYELGMANVYPNSLQSDRNGNTEPEAQAVWDKFIQGASPNIKVEKLTPKDKEYRTEYPNGNEIWDVDGFYNYKFYNPDTSTLKNLLKKGNELYPDEQKQIILSTKEMYDNTVNEAIVGEKIEQEANLRGTMTFRNWTDSLDGEEVTSLNEDLSDVSLDYIKTKLPKLDSYPKSDIILTKEDFVYVSIPQNPNNPFRIVYEIKAFDIKDGTLVAQSSFDYDDNNKLKGTLDVRPDKRRKGIATTIYTLAEKKIGDLIHPEEKHTDSAEKFWQQKNRSFGPKITDNMDGEEVTSLNESPENNKLEYYKNYYSNLSPSIFNVSLEDNNILIKIPDPSINEYDNVGPSTPKVYIVKDDGTYKEAPIELLSKISNLTYDMGGGETNYYPEKNIVIVDNIPVETFAKEPGDIKGEKVYVEYNLNNPTSLPKASKIIASQLVYHLDNREAFAQTVANSLKDGGTFEFQSDLMNKKDKMFLQHLSDEYGFGLPTKLNQYKQESLPLKKGEFVEPIISYIYKITDKDGKTATLSTTKKGKWWEYEKIDGDLDFKTGKFSTPPEDTDPDFKSKERTLRSFDKYLSYFGDSNTIVDFEKLNEANKPYKHKHGFDDKLGKDPFGLNQYARELAQGLEEAIVGDKIKCDNCDWSWDIKDGGDDLFVCHKCRHDNTPQSNLDIPKFNYEKTLSENLWNTLNEITLSKENAVSVSGDLTGGKFTVGNVSYDYSIKNIPNPYKDLGSFYNIQFTPTEEMTSIPQMGKENYIKILSTMYKIIVDFVEKEKPDYIGIASLDNSGKNYHKVYANLTNNKSNNIPGYFRKDVSLEFNSPEGNGRFVVLKRK